MSVVSSRTQRRAVGGPGRSAHTLRPNRTYRQWLVGGASAQPASPDLVAGSETTDLRLFERIDKSRGLTVTVEV
ncbi:hypothetical protein [Gordonia oryzae]|nr:hypothetical protein [Gordonia oryzae]